MCVDANEIDDQIACPVRQASPKDYNIFVPTFSANDLKKEPWPLHVTAQYHYPYVVDDDTLIV